MNNNYAHDMALARKRMVAEQLQGRDIRDARVLKAMTEVPRHVFVDSNLKSQAYNDHPLSIGEKQTISQPYMVALMTQALGLTGREKILEIGTGSGYQTAVLACLSDWVYSVERLLNLSRQAQKNLERVGIFNINLKVGDGSKGWPEQAPYDAILVAAGAPSLPLPLLEQLADPGRLVIPVGDQIMQDLLFITKKDGKYRREVVTGCRFVDLVGQHGW